MKETFATRLLYSKPQREKSRFRDFQDSQTTPGVMGVTEVLLFPPWAAPTALLLDPPWVATTPVLGKVLILEKARTCPALHRTSFKQASILSLTSNFNRQTQLFSFTYSRQFVVYSIKKQSNYIIYSNIFFKQYNQLYRHHRFQVHSIVFIHIMLVVHFGHEI